MNSDFRDFISDKMEDFIFTYDYFDSSERFVDHNSSVYGLKCMRDYVLHLFDLYKEKENEEINNNHS